MIICFLDTPEIEVYVKCGHLKIVTVIVIDTELIETSANYLIRI